MKVKCEVGYFSVTLDISLVRVAKGLKVLIDSLQLFPQSSSLNHSLLQQLVDYSYFKDIYVGVLYNIFVVHTQNIKFCML